MAQTLSAEEWGQLHGGGGGTISAEEFAREHGPPSAESVREGALGPPLRAVRDFYMEPIPRLKEWGEGVATDAEKAAEGLPHTIGGAPRAGAGNALRFLTANISPGDVTMLGTTTVGKILAKGGIKLGTSALAKVTAWLNRAESTAVAGSAVEALSEGDLAKSGLQGTFAALGFKTGAAPARMAEDATVRAAMGTPAVEKGVTRLFRGIPAGSENVVEGSYGRSFVTTEKAAREYAGPDGKILYTDVPDEVASSFEMRAADSSEIAPFEIFAPPDVAAKVQPLREASLEEKMQRALDDPRAALPEQKDLTGVLRSEQKQALDAVHGKWGRQEYADHDEYMQALDAARKGKAGRVPVAPLSPKHLRSDEVTAASYSILHDPNLNSFEIANAQDAMRSWLNGKDLREFEIDLLDRVFPGAKAAAESRKLDGLAFFKDAINVPRAIMASMDMSAILRQNIIFSASHPVMTARAIRSGVKAAPTEEAYKILEREIADHPDLILGKKSGLEVTGLGPDLAKREEEFMTSLAEKLPVLGRLVTMSNRFHVGMLNKVRVDVFGKMAEDLRKAGYTPKKNPAEFEAVANYVNVMTGRGPLTEGLKKVAPYLNAILFSPRFISSRANMLFNPKTYSNLPAPARKQAAKDMAVAVGSVSSVVGLAALHPEVEVDLDFRSADFLKARVGDTRVDLGAGVTQFVRLAAQLGGAAKGGLAADAGDRIEAFKVEREQLSGKVVKETPETTLKRFLMSKEAPTARVAHLAIGGRQGLPEGIKGFAPLAIQDLVQAYQEHGLLAAASVGAIAGVGGGILQYPAPASPEIQGHYKRGQVDAERRRDLRKERQVEDPRTELQKAQEYEKDQKWGVGGENVRAEVLRLYRSGDIKRGDALVRAANQAGYRLKLDELKGVAAMQLRRR